MEKINEIKRKIKDINEGVSIGLISFRKEPGRYQLAMVEKTKLQAQLEELKIKTQLQKVKAAKAEARKRKNGMIFRQGMVCWEYFPEVDPNVLQAKFKEVFGFKEVEK